jgi:hypothetical protein
MPYFLPSLLARTTYGRASSFGGVVAPPPDFELLSLTGGLQDPWWNWLMVRRIIPVLFYRWPEHRANLTQSFLYRSVQSELISVNGNFYTGR